MTMLARERPRARDKTSDGRNAAGCLEERLLAMGSWGLEKGRSGWWVGGVCGFDLGWEGGGPEARVCE